MSIGKNTKFVQCVNLHEDLNKDINDRYENNRKYAYFGPNKCLLSAKFKKYADAIYQMEVRSNDIWVATFPRCGTTWAQEMTWLLNNNLDFDAAAANSITVRYGFLEFEGVVMEDLKQFNNKLQQQTPEKSPSSYMTYKGLMEAPTSSPRYIKTHLPFSLLPPKLLDTAKVVYVARDPRDVAISFYHHNRLFNGLIYTGDFKSYWELFRKNLLPWTPYFSHVKEAWTLRHHPNIMFIFYEEMFKNLPATAKRIANFLGKEYTDEQIAKLCEHLKFDNMKENKSTHPDWLKNSPAINNNAESFYRKGIAGGWRENFDEEMTAQAQRYIDDNLRDTDLQFPEI